MESHTGESWELRFRRVNDFVLSVMPSESNKRFYDPLTGRDVRWEQDVYCPACAVYRDCLVAIYRAYGDDDQWRLGLAWSKDGLGWEREPLPALWPRAEAGFIEIARRNPAVSVSYADPRLVRSEDGTFYLYFNFFQHQVAREQELAVATTRDFVTWTVHGRVFQRVAERDEDVIPEKRPWRFPHPAFVCRLEDDKLVATKIGGRYWMYLNCLSTVGRECLCAATSEDLVHWEVVRDDSGALVHPMPLRPGRFDSYYIDTVAAIVRDDGILLIYNGINDSPQRDGDPCLMQYAHYPAQALFDRDNPTRLLRRSEGPFLGPVPELEQLPRVFWHAPLYEAWSLVPWRGHWFLYWNHGFGRRAVGLMTSAINGLRGRA